MAAIAPLCAIDGCSSSLRTSSVAHRRAFSHSCSVAGCDRLVRGRGFCEKHYMRAHRHAGDVTAGEGRYGNGYPTPDGYIATSRIGHPLARSKGQVQMHRLVLFEKIGPGTHPCHWCEKPVTWGYHVGPDTLVTDHLDENRANNAPENLVPSCVGCNAARSRYGWSW